MVRHVMKSLALASLGLLLVWAGGCEAVGLGRSSGGGPTLDVDNEALDDAFGELGFRREWTGFPIMTENGRVRELYADEGTVAVQESGSTVSMLDPTTGRLLWDNRLGSALTKFISILPYNWRGTPAVLVTSESDVHVLQADTGNLLDRQNLAKVVSTGPVVVGDVAIFGTAGGEIMAHSFASGTRLWGHDLAGPIQAGPTYVHGAVVGVADSGQLASLDATSGALLGRGAIYGGSVTAPVAGDMLFFVASLDQSVWAFDPGSPSRAIWRYQTSAPLRTQPAIFNNTLYVSSKDRGLVALDQRTGDVQWMNEEVRGEVVGVHEGRLVVFNADDRRAFTVSPTSGIIYAEVELPTVAGLRFDEFVDGSLYAWGAGGVVAKYSPRF